MQPTYHPISKIFGIPEQHTVPLFQRPYVWAKEANWEPLWDDLGGLADRVFASSGKVVRGHFLGTVVLEQVKNNTGSIASREIIDGQQRLTTLQILLQAVRHAVGDIGQSALAAGDEAAAKAAHDVRLRFDLLTSNMGYSDEERYKVWPTNEDREPFRQVMDAQSREELAAVQSRMAEAYRFFSDRITAWLKAAPLEPRIRALDFALRENLRLIVLDLDSGDEPQAIFETLNAHGTPLLPADLIKNWLLWEATRQQLPLDNLYIKYWQAFDHDHAHWRALVGTGHAARARIDTFLTNWLTSRCRESVAAKHLYDRFVKRLEDERAVADGVTAKCDVEVVMADISANAERFRLIEAPTGKTRFDDLLRRLSTMGLVVFHPFLLALMARGASDQGDRDRIARVFESYLVRRMICNRETRGYGALCISLLHALAGAGDEGPAKNSILALLSQGSGKLAWPTDEEFERDWQRRQFYNSIRRDRVVMLLRAIEEHYQAQDHKAEPVLQFHFDALQIEHVMPQSWQEHWKVHEEEAKRLRDSKINTIGNLTLVSKALNPTLSNASWLGEEATEPRNGKRDGLEAHSKLYLNYHLVSKNPQRWDEDTIDARAVSLFDVAKAIWPSERAFAATRQL